MRKWIDAKNSETLTIERKSTPDACTLWTKLAEKKRGIANKEREREQKKRMHVVREIENRIDFHQDSILDAS